MRIFFVVLSIAWLGFCLTVRADPISPSERPYVILAQKGGACVGKSCVTKSGKVFPCRSFRQGRWVCSRCCTA